MAGGPALPPPPRRRWLTALMLVVTFGCGVIVGGVGIATFISNRVQEAIHHPERMPERVTTRLAGRLDLSEAQRAKVLDILKRRQQELMAIRREAQPKVEDVLNHIETDVAGELDSTQKERWLADAKRFRERFTPPMPK